MKALRIIAPLAAFIVAAVVMLPLRFAWSMVPTPPDLSVSGMEGTLWSGEVRGVSWSGIDLGNFRTSTNLWDLLPSPLVKLDQGAGLLKAAAIRGSDGSVSIAEADIRVPLSLLDSRLPESSMLRVLDGRIDLSGPNCTLAAGRISVDAAPQLDLPALSGELACSNGELITIISTQAGGRAAIAFSIDGSTPPRLREATPDLALALAVLGLETTSGAPE